MPTYEHVLSPIQIGSRIFKNRVSFAPVWPSFATADGHVNTELMEWARSLAKGGVACVNIGSCSINRNLPKEVAHLLRMGQESVVNELSSLCDLIHLYNCMAGIEIYPISPINEAFETRDRHGKIAVEVDPTGLSCDDIRCFIEDYVTAADRAVRAGADVLVIHGAHGQLPACFFSKAINMRDDNYGPDSIENRSRFADEMLTAIREKVGNKVAIEYRINADDMLPGSPTIKESIEFVRIIQDKIDLLHVSRGMHSMQALTPYIFPPMYFEHGINIEDASLFKKALDIPVTTVGSITLEMAEQAIAEGKIDMVSIARGLLADPNMIRKAKHGQAENIRPCIRCNNCINKTHYFLAPIRCAVNAEQGMEAIYAGIPESKEKKKIAVIGGGPGGMEAARVAAERGHQVVLFEKSGCLGGTLNLASSPQFKKDIKRYLEWAIRQTTSQPNIEVRMEQEATPEAVKQEGFDVVIVSVGSTPIIPEFIRDFPKKAVWVGDVETGKARVGDIVVVVGAGLTGCEAALDLAQKGKKVTLIDLVKKEQFGNGGTKINQFAINEMLKKYQVELIGDLKLTGVNEKGIFVRDLEGRERSIPCDTAVISLGVRPKLEMANRFKSCAPDVIFVGDCSVRQGTLYNAVHTAHAAATTLC